MGNLTVVRLYFTAARMHAPASWWKRLAPESLGTYLLKQAKESHIEQALLHRVIGGFLKDQNLVMDTGEIPPAKLPQCLELVGEEDVIREFLSKNESHLKNVRVVFLRGEEARYEAAVEKEELEEMLEIENSEEFKREIG